MNDFEFRVISPKRSGHHALVLWLSGLFDDSVLHLNDIELRKDPFATCKGQTFINELLGKGSPTPNPESDRRCVVLSYEDLDLTKVKGDSDFNSNRWLGDSGHIRNLLCLRDPYNMLASRFALWSKDVTRRHAEILEMWCDHAREFLGHTKILSGRIAVNFNRFVMEECYRRELCGELGLPFRDAGFRPIPSGVIGGSSFSDTYGSRVSAVDLLFRWKIYEKNANFWRFFSAVPEAEELSRKIFGPIVDRTEYGMGLE